MNRFMFSCFLLSLLFVNCTTKRIKTTINDKCLCDSIYDYSDPLTLISDRDSNLISYMKKVPFKHCLSLSDRIVKTGGKTFNPLLLNHNEIIGYIEKNSTEYKYVDTDFKNEELLFDFVSNDSTWVIKYGYFSNYKISVKNKFNYSDSIYSFQFEYLGLPINEGFYYHKISLTKKNILLIEFSNGVKCSCL